MFIDRNGKIFGKINIIDFIFVLLLSFLAFVFYPKLRQLYVLELVPLYYKDKSKMSLIKDGSFNHVGQETKKISIPVIPKKLEEKNLVIKVNFGGNHKEVARVIKAGDWDEQEPTTRILKILYVNPVIRTDLKGKIFQDPNFQDVTLEL